MAAKAAPPKAEIDELLDERERQQRVDALVGRVRRDPTLLTSYTWKWRTSVAATHVLLGLVVYHALTRVIVAEARGMIDTIDVHALGLGDGDAGTYTWRQHLVACAQATAWATLLTLVLVAELTSACNALLGRHAWTPCAFHNVLASTRMDATLAMLKTLAVLYLGWFTRTPTLATVFTPEAGDSNKLLGEFIFTSVWAISSDVVFFSGPRQSFSRRCCVLCPRLRLPQHPGDSLGVEPRTETQEPKARH